MSKSILEVPGIGESTAKNLALHGIKSANDLAAATIDKLMAVKGFNTIRAAHIIQAGKDLVHIAAAENEKTQQKKSAEAGKSKKAENTEKEEKAKKAKKAKKKNKIKNLKKKSDKKKPKSKKAKGKKSSGKKKKKKK